MEKFIYTPSPAGDEGAFSKLIAEEISPFCDSTRVDAMGNVIATKNGRDKNALPLYLCAHLDTAGFVVKYINDDGTLCVHPTGTHVRASDSYEKLLINGNVGFILPKGDDAYTVDIGAKTREEAEKLVCLGDFAAIIPDLFEFADGRIVSYGLSSKLPCSILLDIARQIKNPAREINFVFTVQKDISSRGARLISSTLSSETACGCAIVLDCIDGKGECAIGVSDSLCVYSDDAINAVSFAAQRASVICEKKVLESALDVQSFLHAGLCAGALTLPIENMGTTCEVASPDTINNAKSILISLCGE